MKEFPPFHLDPVNQCLWRRRDGAADERILLSPKAYAVLLLLVDHAGRLVTQEEILDAVWKGVHVQPQVVKSHIVEIRAALGDSAQHPHFIETLHRRGYRFIATVEDVTKAHSPAPPKASYRRVVGRERELGELGIWLQKAVGAERQVVFITGEPGIGKTTVADEFQRRALAAVPNLRVARGQCIEGYGGKEAYYPMLEALRDLCRGPGGEAVVQILAAQAPTWLVQFPAFVTREQRVTLQREIIGATRERMLREIGAALAAISSEGPLVLVFEDLHWVDPSTVDLISAVARGRTPAKLMLIATFRPVDAALFENPLLAVKQDLLVHRLSREIALEPLAQPEIVEYLAMDSGSNLPDGLAELVYRRSEGNPLFMVAALDHLTERKLVSRDSGSWKLLVPLEKIDFEVPESLRQMVEAQIDRLTAEEQRALELASVAPVSFSAHVCAAAASLDPLEFGDLCEGLSRRHHIVCSDGFHETSEGRVFRYKFVHSLYREVFYRRQPAGRRPSLHQRIGERLETLFSNQLSEVAAELAYHFEESRDWSRAVKYLRLSAEIATQRFAHREAATLLKRALELHQGPVGERANLLASLARAQRGLDLWDVVVANLREALEMYVDLKDPETIVGTVSELTDALFWLGRYEEATETARRGLTYLQADVSADRARLFATLGWAYAGTRAYEPAQEALREALKIASQLSDPKLECRLLGVRSIINWQFFRLRESATDGLLSEQLGESDLPPWQRALQLNALHFALLHLGRLEEALRIADVLEPLANKIGQHFSLAFCLSNRAWIDFGKAPDLATLEARFQRVWKSDLEASSAYLKALSEVRLSLLDFFHGNWMSALSHAQAALQEQGTSIEGLGIGMLFRQMAYAGDRDSAMAILDGKRALLPRSGQPNTVGSWRMLALVIEGLVMLGEQEQAGQLYPLVRELIDTGAVVFLVISRFTQTIAGVAAAAARQWRAAEEHFEVAMQQAASFPYLLEQAEISRFHAMMLMERGRLADRKRAGRMLTLALETYTGIGMPRHCDLTKALMDQVH